MAFVASVVPSDTCLLTTRADRTHNTLRDAPADPYKNFFFLSPGSDTTIALRRERLTAAATAAAYHSAPWAELWSVQQGSALGTSSFPS